MGIFKFIGMFKFMGMFYALADYFNRHLLWRFSPAEHPEVSVCGVLNRVREGSVWHCCWRGYDY